MTGETAGQRTTHLGVVPLGHAGCGEFGAELGCVLVARPSGNAAELGAAMAALLAAGAASDLDAALGVSISIRVLRSA